MAVSEKTASVTNIMSARGKKPVASIETITPTIAHAMLQGNTDNRKIRPQRVAMYANDMKCGVFILSNDAVMITKDGELLNGQHRLLAVIKSKKPQPFLVMRNANPRAYVIMDSGLKRNASDVLSRYGYKGGVSKNSLTRCYRLMALKLEEDEEKATNSLVESKARRPISNSEILQIHIDHPDIVPFGEMLLRKNPKSSRKITVSHAIFGYWLLHDINKRDCAEFFRDLEDQTNLKKGDPVLALMRAYATSPLFSVTFRTHVAREQMFSLFILAWNMRRTGEKATKLKYTNAIRAIRPL